MYDRTEFSISPEDNIISDLRELSVIKDRINRIYLLNGDPFVLPAEKLLRIAELIHEYLPKVSLITCYASIRDIKNKSFEDIQKLREAGMDYIAIIMNGIADREKSQEHVEATVRLLNETQPAGVGPMSTSVSPGSELEALRNQGIYTELTEGEILEEEIALLEGLELDPQAFWFGSHIFNNVSVSGIFKQKDEMLARLKAGLEAMSEEERSSIRDRGHI